MNRPLLALSALVLLAGGCALIVGAIRLVALHRTGERVQATVGDCAVSGAGRFRRVHCTGTWTSGGSLLEGGRVVWGPIVGAEADDAGKTIEVIASKDGAYTRSFMTFMPILFAVLGVLSLLGGVLLGRAWSR